MNIALGRHGGQPWYAVSAGATTRASSGRWTAASTQVVVTGVGHWRGEGLALVEAVD